MSSVFRMPRRASLCTWSAVVLVIACDTPTRPAVSPSPTTDVVTAQLLLNGQVAPMGALAALGDEVVTEFQLTATMSGATRVTLQTGEPIQGVTQVLLDGIPATEAQLAELSPNALRSAHLHAAGFPWTRDGVTQLLELRTR